MFQQPFARHRLEQARADPDIKWVEPIYIEHDAALWGYLADGTLPMVASDHSPAPATREAPISFGRRKAQMPRAEHPDKAFGEIRRAVADVQFIDAPIISKPAVQVRHRPGIGRRDVA